MYESNKENLKNTPYTVESLKAETRNELYDSENGVNDKDVTFSNIYQLLIQESRRSWQPAAGDILIMKDGKRRHIDEVESWGSFKNGKSISTLKISTCQNAYTSFIRAKVGDSTATLSLSTSGGPWESVEVESSKIELKSVEEKFFCFFGHSGARANGAVDFRAKVNVWQLI